MGSKLRKKLRLFLTNSRFMANRRGAITAQRVIGYAISFFLIGVVFPIGMDAVMNATTTGWDSSVTTIFQVLLPILVVIGIAIDYLPTRGK